MALKQTGSSLSPSLSLCHLTTLTCSGSTPSNPQDTESNAPKRPRPSGPINPNDQKPSDPKPALGKSGPASHPPAAASNAPPPSNNQPSHQNQGQGQGGQGRKPFDNPPPAAIATSSPSLNSGYGPPMSDFEKREQRFGGGNRGGGGGGMGRGPPNHQNRGIHDAGHNNGNNNLGNERRDSNKGMGGGARR
jgi:hypothetical protein